MVVYAALDSTGPALTDRMAERSAALAGAGATSVIFHGTEDQAGALRLVEALRLVGARG